jgi:hypothetical protein
MHLLFDLLSSLSITTSNNLSDIMDNGRNLLTNSSASPPTNPTVPTSFTSTSQGVSFLSLPGELRNKIYQHVLPDRLLIWEPGRPLRQDGARAYTNLMATSRRVYTEAVDLVYGGHGIIFTIEEGHLIFFNQRIELDRVAEYCFSFINYSSVLHIFIRTTDSCIESICKVQVSGP